jgi:predicted patatin/cPLA2 family phospholipase
MEFIFGEIPEKLDPFDYVAFAASPCRYYAGATDVLTGKAVFFGKEQVAPGLEVLRASCSIPMLSPPVTVNGREYLDGGVAAPIPIDKALDEGCEKLVVVLTRPRGFEKKPQGQRPLYHLALREYPNMVKAMDMRHLVYNHTLHRLRRLEEQGRAVVVAPPEGLEVGRFGKNRNRLMEAFRVGERCGGAALARL